MAGYFCPFKFADSDEWDIAPIKISEKYKGNGICNKAMSEFYKDKKGYIYIYDKNIASIKCFTRNGFIKDRQDEDGWYYKKE